ncbi:GAG-pre-integrase domain [Rhizoctonia solani]|uniref:GAG-pre-integrase domain n=1 Tax=Rhizoctonia solani TaxID=456999 RepID=A0A8H7I3A4_9AGAM|nr:GAG-pre-integrase domain [Rhizoctonia solani]
MFVHLLKHKNEFPARFRELVASLENQTGNRIVSLRTNGGGKYCSDKFEGWMKTKGIGHQKTKANSSLSNGVAERGIRTMGDFNQTMREDANLPAKYWGYAILHSALLWNITPKKFPRRQDPRRTWARVPNNKQTKLQPKSIKCTYLGYAPNRKAHLLVIRSTGKIFTLRDVVFDKGGETRQRIIIEDNDNLENAKEVSEKVGESEKPKNVRDKVKEQEPDVLTRVDDKPLISNEPPPTRRSTRISRPPARYGSNVGGSARIAMSSNWEYKSAFAALKMDNAPQNFKEAMSQDNSHLWMQAMIEEIDSITKHRVWMATQRPSGKNIVGCMWVYSYKLGPDGEIVQYKARLVAKGYSQQPGIDYSKISSPVAASDAFCILLALTTLGNLELLQLDIKTAFLHGNLDEEIYMEQPEGFDDGSENVWRLVKALYGLKQAARAFYLRLKEVLEGIGFTRCESDYAVFIKQDENNLAIILAHVDDMLLAGKPLTYLEEIKSKLRELFELVDLGEAKMFVGVKIERDRNEGTLKNITEAIHQ